MNLVYYLWVIKRIVRVQDSQHQWRQEKLVATMGSQHNVDPWLSREDRPTTKISRCSKNEKPFSLRFCSCRQGRELHALSLADYVSCSLCLSKIWIPLSAGFWWECRIQWGPPLRLNLVDNMSRREVELYQCGDLLPGCVVNSALTLGTMKSPQVRREGGGSKVTCDGMATW